MLCQKCKKNQATVYYKQNINGSVSQIALCQDCAKELGTFDDGGLFASGALNLLGNLFGERNIRPAYVPVMQKVCPLCGSTLRDIKASGKVQCAKCYEVFADELAPIIANIHGNVRHTGRSPVNFHSPAVNNGEEAVKDSNNVNNTDKTAEITNNKLTQLKAELSDAIKNEAYEEAAKLRDEIRALEKEGE